MAPARRPAGGGGPGEPKNPRGAGPPPPPPPPPPGPPPPPPPAPPPPPPPPRRAPPPPPPRRWRTGRHRTRGDERETRHPRRRQAPAHHERVADRARRQRVRQGSRTAGSRALHHRPAAPRRHLPARLV